MPRPRHQRRKCLCCKAWFVPDPRKRRLQRYCSKEQCRRSSKAASQRRWLRKPQNEEYFQGPEHVNRVQRWRRAHPGYWRCKIASARAALQDLIDTQALERSGKTRHSDRALQEMMAGLPRWRVQRPAAQANRCDIPLGTQRVNQFVPATHRSVQSTSP